MSQALSAGGPALARPIGQQRDPGFVIVMYIITLGLYGIYWVYKSFKEVKAYRGQGVGGVAGVLLTLIVVSYFLLPAYVGRMYREDGEQNPLSGQTGFWIFLPYVGGFVWAWRIQAALNEFWAGASREFGGVVPYPIIPPPPR
jgi:apolipoprotein N-acyltransferase